MHLKYAFLIALEHILQIYLPPSKVTHSLYTISDKLTLSETSQGHRGQLSILTAQ